MKAPLFIIILFFGSQLALSQFMENFSGSLESTLTYYTDDDKIINPGDSDFRSNNYLRFNYFKNDFSANVQLESYIEEALLGYSPVFNEKIGLSLFSLAYKKEKFSIEAGYIFDQFSEGLSFRSWEDRQLGLNNALFGAHIAYQFKTIRLTGFAGKQKNGFDLSDGSLMGLNAFLNLSKKIDLDFGIVSRYQEFESENPDFSEFTNLYSLKGIYTSGSFYSHLEYIYKGNDALVEFGNVFDSRLFTGNALSLNFGYFKSGFGIDGTFRRLENMAFYTDREAYGNIYNELIVNYIPALTKQHNVGLSNIYVYQAQPQISFLSGGKSGEIGQQIDAFYRFSKKNSFLTKYQTVLAVNYSSWFGLKATYDLENRTYSSEFLAYGEQYYSDLNFEIKNQWSTNWKTRFLWINQYYNKTALEGNGGKVNTNILALDSYLTIGAKNELRIQAEHLWTQDDGKNWAGGLIEFTFLRKFSLYVNDLYNYGNELETERIHYYNAGATYRKGKTRLSLNYGRQRGGLICIGGVCRFVPKSNGLTFGMNLYL
ncbi:DUF6029 family protein [Lutimonas saemankumensis]|uniref:DUF6029 family protein n=1 Tax=Lutimonas saemankumensis TaxID=483016 RepID=UPI001CD7A653|nr:DUF6029 family protein [Lutimonas saemankumensis]MCA0933502.1 DUF6029 family protein [Lutimonas saemankumensis]